VPMNRCAGCGVSVEVRPLFRANPLGEAPGIFKCLDCIETPPPDDQVELANLLAAAGPEVLAELDTLAGLADHPNIITDTPPRRCQLCGAEGETRPYGPLGEEVCFDCGMTDEPAAARAFAARLNNQN
jgi:hypothetical protein